MNICYISNSAAPSRNASSLQIAKLCEALSYEGHSVSLIIPNTGNLKQNFFKYYDIKNKYKLIRIKYFDKFPRGLLYYLYSITSVLKSKIRDQNLYITRNFFTSFILSFLKKKHILDIHDDIGIEGRIIKFFIKNLKILNNKNLIKIITTTHSLKKRYTKAYKVPRNKVKVLHNGSYIESKFKVYNSKKKINKIGYFGSVYESRGIKMIIRLSKIDKNNKYYIFGGSKSDNLNFKKQCNHNNINFKSYVPYSKIKRELGKIDICILPYSKKITVSGNVGNIYKYTSPLKIFDYMKCGKLIICSNLKVLREVLKNNVNSILIDDYSEINSWIKEIAKIKKNRKKFNNLRYNGFNYANKYDMRWRAREMLSTSL